MKYFPKTYLLSLSLALFGAQHALAGPISFYNTGVASDGSLLAPGSSDSHYSLIYSSGGGTTAVAMNGNGGWTSSSTAGWIGPTSDGNQGSPCGYYIYETVLDLTGYEASTASLSGEISVDDQVQIFLNRNANSLLFSSSGFSTYTPFTINSGFIDGVNLVDFVVYNSSGPTGFNVDQTYASAQAPEPQSVFLLATGLVGSASFLFKRRAHPHLN